MLAQGLSFYLFIVEVYNLAYNVLISMEISRFATLHIQVF